MIVYGTVASVDADGWFTVMSEIRTYDVPSYAFVCTPYRQPIVGERVGLAIAPGGGVVRARPDWVPKP